MKDNFIYSTKFTWIFSFVFYVVIIVKHNSEVDHKGNTFFARAFFRCQGNIVNKVLFNKVLEKKTQNR